MSVKSRLLALKLLEKQKQNPEFARLIGIEINVVNKKDDKQTHECNGFKKEAI